MTPSSPAQPSRPAELSAGSCRERQRVLLDRLSARGLTAALIVGRRNVHYLTGHWSRSVLPSAVLLRQNEPALLALPGAATSDAADVVTFVGDRLGTLVEDGQSAAVDALLASGFDNSRVGSDRALFQLQTESIVADLLAMRRRKWPDEMVLLRRGIDACDAAYAAAAKLITPGLSELQLFAAVQSAATLSAGEPVGELGNDFRSGEPGGPPRERAMQAGELLPLDLGVCVRGYTADLCRTFAVGRTPSAEQVDAHAVVVDVLGEIENMAGPGVSCRKLYDHADRRLRGKGDTRFGHHLGHGVGLAAHEAPRLNPHWDDTLAVGDVFTVEPGLYGPSLRGGVRVEQMFHVTATGVERLSDFPVSLTP